MQRTHNKENRLQTGAFIVSCMQLEDGFMSDVASPTIARSRDKALLSTYCLALPDTQQCH